MRDRIDTWESWPVSTESATATAGSLVLRGSGDAELIQLALQLQNCLRDQVCFPIHDQAPTATDLNLTGQVAGVTQLPGNSLCWG